MRIKKGKEADYCKFIEINGKDFYYVGVVDYAKRWAEMMEAEMSLGKNLTDIANNTSIEADTEGITGFMYGCAVAALSEFWEYGEELRKWHNREHGYDGDGVVNPAILTIG